MISEYTEPQEGYLYESIENINTPVGELLKGSRGAFLEGRIEFYVPEKDCTYYFNSDHEDFNKIKLIGKLNLTHTLKDGKLTKIERDYIIQENDVFSFGEYCLTVSRAFKNENEYHVIYDDGSVDQVIEQEILKGKRIGVADIDIKYIKTEG